MYVVYSKQMCSSCDTAKLLLETENYEHVIKILNVDFNVLELYSVIPKSHRSFPAITKLENGVEEYVGGLKELCTDIEKGGL
ncbi:glutaredoxin [Vibrio phage vB_VhaM_VH-8]|nr:glutaredoxin [Vibrio phage vB_VhaM_VH-8]